MANPVFKYGNGFDILRCKTALSGRLKWASDGGVSKSQRYFDDGSFHAMVTEATLKDSQPDPTVNAIKLGEVKKQLEASAIRRALDLVFQTSNLIDEPSPVYGIVPNQTRSAELPAKDFSGYEITASGIDSVVQINSATLFFSEDTSVKLYLFLEGEAVPIWEQVCEAVKDKHSTTQLVDCYMSSSRFKTDIFYFGYKVSELQNGAKPYREDGVKTCGAALWGSRSVYSDIPISYGRAQYPGVMYGLNLEISGLADYTERIEKNPAMFDELLGLCMASMVLEQSVFSSRKNDTTRALTPNDKASIQMDLTGTAPITDIKYSPGNIRKRMVLEAEKLRSSFNKKYSGVYTLP